MSFRDKRYDVFFLNKLFDGAEITYEDKNSANKRRSPSKLGGHWNDLEAIEEDDEDIVSQLPQNAI